MAYKELDKIYKKAKKYADENPDCSSDDIDIIIESASKEYPDHLIYTQIYGRLLDDGHN